MIYTYNFGKIYFQWWEWILIPLIIFFIYTYATLLVKKKIAYNSNYKYFKKALFFKLFAGGFFGIIYVFYYGGGDTISYYSNTMPLVNLFYENPEDYFRILFQIHEFEIQEGKNYFETIRSYYFNSNTGFPLYMMGNDPKTFAVCKITSVFMLFLGNSFFATTLIIAFVTFLPIWRLYIMFCSEFKGIEKPLAFAVLFIPSVLFWGSGIMKDTYTFSATCIVVTSTYYLFQKNRVLSNLILMFAALFLILSIKPYVLNVLVPSISIWLFMIIIKKIKNSFVKFLVLPLAFAGVLGGSFFVLKTLGSSMDKFSLDNAVKTTIITQDDLKREHQYGSNNFDIGAIDGTLSNMILKIPTATFAGLFRPLIVESNNIVMLLSGIENLILIILTFWVLFKTSLAAIWKLMMQHEIMFFCITFVFVFAFMIGLTTPNFGALVRFKIPLLPFFAAFLMIIFHYKKIETKTSFKN